MKSNKSLESATTEENKANTDKEQLKTYNNEKNIKMEVTKEKKDLEWISTSKEWQKRIIESTEKEKKVKRVDKKRKRKDMEEREERRDNKEK